MKPVWIVDDDRSIRWVFEKALSREGIAYSSFASAQEALEALYARPVDLVTAGSLQNPYFVEAVNKSRQLVYAAEDAQAA